MAGPYYVSSYVPGREIIVRRNPNYRGTRPQRIPEFIYTIGFDPSQSVQRYRDEVVQRSTAPRGYKQPLA